MKTAQVHSHSKPESHENVMAMGIFCPKCGTGRVFKIKETLRLLSARFIHMFTVKTVCEKCGHKIATSIGWIEDKKQYSYRAMENNNEQFMSVEDENGLDTIS